jgi:hypothetical protein
VKQSLATASTTDPARSYSDGGYQSRIARMGEREYERERYAREFLHARDRESCGERGREREVGRGREGGKGREGEGGAEGEGEGEGERKRERERDVITHDGGSTQGGTVGREWRREGPDVCVCVCVRARARVWARARVGVCVCVRVGVSVCEGGCGMCGVWVCERVRAMVTQPSHPDLRVPRHLVCPAELGPPAARVPEGRLPVRRAGVGAGRWRKGEGERGRL